MTLEILKVAPDQLHVERTCKKSLKINSIGYTPTTGWTRGRLVLKTPIGKARNGKYEFDFVAETPVGISLLKISEIAAEPYVWMEIPSDLKIIRVNGGDNFVEKELDNFKELFPL